MQILVAIVGVFLAELFVLIELGGVFGTLTVLFYCLALMFVGGAVARLAQRDMARVFEASRAMADERARGFAMWTMSPLGQRGDLAPFASWMTAAMLFAIPGVLSDVAALVFLVIGWRAQRRRDRRPVGASARAAPRRGKAAVAEVEVLPPGQVESPFRTRPRVIDVD